MIFRVNLFCRFLVLWYNRAPLSHVKTEFHVRHFWRGRGRCCGYGGHYILYCGDTRRNESNHYIISYGNTERFCKIVITFFSCGNTERKKKYSIHYFLWKYRRKEIWFITFHADIYILYSQKTHCFMQIKSIKLPSETKNR